ncbi:neuronal acetylcholine receptor subunit alpha-10-like [Actinia tenebrosa]|uniref:Neuronal acetylcholine receptor subunit alpha-10-like n=1 Tax=Actinia tenebrosa TaxID=6105 RepID=A0A6P8IS14_ACTTE|nr:neuronal acetylcholine receptor subunit alpha-10-like [Actinia tenebrosa]
MAHSLHSLVVVLTVTRLVDCINYQQLLLRDLFRNYDSDANPGGTGNELSAKGASVTFAAKLVRVIELNERANTIQTQWWIQQKWINKDLSWNKTKYGNVTVVYVDPKRVWTPDILLHNSVRLFDSAADDDRLSGSTDKYKTKIGIYPDGQHYWLAPAMFKSVCDVNTRFFPFDDQTCTLQFGSWAFDSSKLDMIFDRNESGTSPYQMNTEWELLAFDATLKYTKYSCCQYPYTSVLLEVKLRRRFYYYMVNLVVPCSLIAIMVLLSFVLPPEAGERISLGITVLMAMAIFQELTSEKLPVESTHTPLLAQYYSSAIAEIGLAIFATSIILNFHYRKNKMPNYLRKLIFSFAGPIVGMKKYKDLARSEKLLRRGQERANGTSNDNEHFKKGNNCELKSLSLLQNDLIACEKEPRNEFQRGKNHSSIRETHILEDSEDNSADQEDKGDNVEKELADIYAKEWQEAARILDRLVLLVAIVVCICTFAAIFIQAPRVQEHLFGDPAITEEQRLLLRRK